MNRITYNYKFHCEEVVDGRTMAGIIDMGFRDYKRRHLQLAGMEFPNFQKIRDKDEKARARKLWESSKSGLESILLYRDHEPAQPHGRTIVIAPYNPNRNGRCLTNAYVPCRQESFDHPHLTRRIAGYVFLNVVHYLQYIGERGFDLNAGLEILDLLEPYDFDK